MLSFGLQCAGIRTHVAAALSRVLRRVPGFRAIRVPARLGLLALVGLGGLAGLGADLLWHCGRPAGGRRRAAPSVGRVGPCWARWPSCVALLGIGVESLSRMELPDSLPTQQTAARLCLDRAHPAPTLELPMGDGRSPRPGLTSGRWSTGTRSSTAIPASSRRPITRFASHAEFPNGDTLRCSRASGCRTSFCTPISRHRPHQCETQLAANPAATLALAGPDAVYRLAPDPWMFRLADATPDGATVDLPAAASDPVAWGLLVAVLQREGRSVTGVGQIDYLTLKPTASPRCYAILPTGADPATYGYADARCNARSRS